MRFSRETSDILNDDCKHMPHEAVSTPRERATLLQAGNTVNITPGPVAGAANLLLRLRPPTPPLLTGTQMPSAYRSLRAVTPELLPLDDDLHLDDPLAEIAPLQRPRKGIAPLKIDSIPPSPRSIPNSTPKARATTRHRRSHDDLELMTPNKEDTPMATLNDVDVQPPFPRDASVETVVVGHKDRKRAEEGVPSPPQRTVDNASARITIDDEAAERRMVRLQNGMRAMRWDQRTTYDPSWQTWSRRCECCAMPRFWKCVVFAFRASIIAVLPAAAVSLLVPNATLARG